MSEKGKKKIEYFVDPFQEDDYTVNDVNDEMKKMNMTIDFSNIIKDQVKPASELIFNFDKEDYDSQAYSKNEIVALYNH